MVKQSISEKIIWIMRNRQLNAMRKSGVEVGKGVVIFSPRYTKIDCSRPWLLSIGDYTKITSGVIILTHDYSLSVMRRKYGEWIGEGRKTTIGSNCFIGMNAIVLAGTNIGDNCIVGAGSVCHGIYPSDSVIAGNPARVIMSLDDYYSRRKERTVHEALECGRLYKGLYAKNPAPSVLSDFKWLFTPRNKEILMGYGVDSFYCNGDEPIEVEKAFYESEPYWPSFDDYLKEMNNMEL